MRCFSSKLFGLHKDTQKPHVVIEKKKKKKKNVRRARSFLSGPQKQARLNVFEVDNRPILSSRGKFLHNSKSLKVGICLQVPTLCPLIRILFLLLAGLKRTGSTSDEMTAASKTCAIIPSSAVANQFDQSSDIHRVE